MKESRYNTWVQRGESAYVYNGVSGGLLRLSSEDHAAVQDYLRDENGSSYSPLILKRLILGQMLVPTDFDEIELLAKRYAASRHDTSHFNLTIVTSLGCNFDCPYCFEAKHPSLLDEETQQAVLEVVDDQLQKVSSFRVTWFGGEPLVGKQALLDLSDAFIERCDRADVSYEADITTNGYLLSEETCVQLRDRRLSHVQVSLDGPPEIHDSMRPLTGGKGTFWRIVENLHSAVNYLPITVRVNVDTQNITHVEKLLQILANEGLANKLAVYVGQIVAIKENLLAPSATYKNCCFTNREFAEAEHEFVGLATRYGFSSPSLPKPTGAPCTAVRANELVVGSKGDLYKCWDSVGNLSEVIGDIRDYQNMDGRLRKWLKYDPFSDAECPTCIALPVCMGGCAHHAMDPLQYENRCGTFRNTYHEQVLRFVEFAEESGMTAPISVELSRRTETQ